MGKDLRGKELGVGISQRKDGLYTARFTDKGGKRKQQYFKKLQECRNWIADAQFADEHGGINASSDMSVNAWFDYWIAEIKGKTVRWNTLNNYKNQYNKNIKEFIGNMLIKDVKPMHCQNVLNIMDNNGYASGSMERARSTMSAMFSDACENDIISVNPVTKSVKYQKKEKNDARVLTLEEQEKLLSAAKGSVNYNHFLFALQTGVRLSELRGLKWCNIDFQNRIIRIRKTFTYNSSTNKFIIDGLKTNSGQRDIPMTNAVYEILTEIKNNNEKKRSRCISA